MFWRVQRVWENSLVWRMRHPRAARSRKEVLNANNAARLTLSNMAFLVSYPKTTMQLHSVINGTVLDLNRLTLLTGRKSQRNDFTPRRGGRLTGFTENGFWMRVAAPDAFLTLHR